MAKKTEIERVTRELDKITSQELEEKKRSINKQLIETFFNKENFPTFHTLPLQKKTAIIYYYHTFGNISATMRKVGLTRRNFNYWYNKDPDFAIIIDSLDVREELLDYTEEKLIEHLNSEDKALSLSASKFIALTQGKHRGYSYRDINEGQDTTEDKTILIIPDNGRNDPLPEKHRIFTAIPENATKED